MTDLAISMIMNLEQRRDKARADRDLYAIGVFQFAIDQLKALLT